MTRPRGAMNIICLALVMVLFAISALAQTAIGPLDVAVLESKWRIDVRNPALEIDPLAGNKDRLREEAAQKANAQQSQNRVRQGENALPPVVRQPRSDSGPRGIWVTYVYQVKLKNTGSKKIRRLVWDYVFTDPGTTIEAGRRRFVSKTSIKPGATRKLSVRLRSGPTGTVDATKADKKERDQYSEKVIIRRIEYADGSVWQLGSR